MVLSKEGVPYEQDQEEDCSQERVDRSLDKDSGQQQEGDGPINESGFSEAVTPKGRRLFYWGVLMYVMRPNDGYKQSLRDLAKSLLSKGAVSHFVEIGSFSGESAVIWHESLPDSTIWCIDPWLPGYDPNDAASNENMTAVEKAFDRRVFGCERLVKLKGTSDDFKSLSCLQSVDAVYVDAMHTYEGAKADIEFWLPRCKLAITGHDYNGGWPGVIKAVDEVVGKPDFIFPDSSWLKWIKR